MLPLESEDGWKFYETCARDSRLKGAEVVSEVVSLTGGEILVQGTSMTKEVIADPIIVEQPSQNECHMLLIGLAWVARLLKLIWNLMPWLEMNFMLTHWIRSLAMNKMLMKMMNHQTLTMKIKVMRLW
jgi:hypothetical protein